MQKIKTLSLEWGSLSTSLHSDPDFNAEPECRLVFNYLTTPCVFCCTLLYIDVSSGEVLGNNITMWVHQTNISRPVVFVLDLHSTCFPFPETALIYVSVRSYSTMFLQVFLLGNSPGSKLFFQHNQMKNSIYSSPQVILLCSQDWDYNIFFFFHSSCKT